MLGPLGHLVRHASDLGTALRDIILFLHVHDRGAVPSLWVRGDRALLGYTIIRPMSPVPADLRRCRGDHLPDVAGPDRSGLGGSRGVPVSPAAHRHRALPALLPHRLRFGAEYYGVAFAAAWLDRPLANADAQVDPADHAGDLALSEQEGSDLVAHVSRVLRRLLVGGAGQAETSLARRIEAVFDPPPHPEPPPARTRRTSFKALIDATRYDMARQLLRDTRLPVAEIAAALDYSEPAAFNRAFRRWSGTVPLAWRARNAPV